MLVRRLVLLVALLGAAACGDSGASSDRDGAAVEAAGQRGPRSAAPPPADLERPAILLLGTEDVPNPFVMVEDGTWYLYASQEHLFLEDLPVRTSTDGRTFDKPVNVLPVLPEWADPGFTWAPDVRRVGDRYVMWFTARLKGQDRPTQCIGVAVAGDPLGPFVGEPAPSICQLERRGSIDPRMYQAPDGTLWMHWKSDDNADVDGTTKASIYAQRLAPDGITLQGEAVEILTADQAWEGRIVEAPQLVDGDDGRLWLFYSGNWFNQPVYAIGAAACETPAGPCTKPLDGPWLASNGQGAGPGEASLFDDAEGRTWIVYAPWAVQFETKTPRPVASAHVAFGEDGPYLARP